MQLVNNNNKKKILKEGNNILESKHFIFKSGSVSSAPQV